MNIDRKIVPNTMNFKFTVFIVFDLLRTLKLTLKSLKGKYNEFDSSSYSLYLHPFHARKQGVLVNIMNKIIICVYTLYLTLKLLFFYI